MAEAPHRLGHAGLADERVVLGDRAVGVDARNLAEQAVHALGLHAALGDRPVAHGDEERAVAMPDQAAAEVQPRIERRRLAEDHLHVVDPRRRAVDQRAAGHGGVVHAAVARLGVAPVDQLVGGEFRIERHVEQAALAARVHGRQPGDRLRLGAVGIHHPQPARPLGHEHPAVGQERYPPRVLQALGHRDHVELDVELLLGRARLAGDGRLLRRVVGRPPVDARPLAAFLSQASGGGDEAKERDQSGSRHWRLHAKDVLRCYNARCNTR